MAKKSLFWRSSVNSQKGMSLNFASKNTLTVVKRVNSGKTQNSVHVSNLFLTQCFNFDLTQPFKIFNDWLALNSKTVKLFRCEFLEFFKVRIWFQIYIFDELAIENESWEFLSHCFEKRHLIWIGIWPQFRKKENCSHKKKVMKFLFPLCTFYYFFT